MSLQQGVSISKSYLLGLPAELVQLIIEKVEPSDVENLRLTCRLISELTKKRVVSHRRTKNRYAGLGSMNIRRIRQMIEELSNDPGQSFYPRYFHVPDLNGRIRTPFDGLTPQLELVLARSLENFLALPPSHERLCRCYTRRDYFASQPRTSTELISNLGSAHYRAISALLVIMLPNVEEFVCKETDRLSLEQLAKVLEISSNSINLGMSNRLLGARLSIIHLATFDVFNLASLLALPVLKTLQIKHLYKSSMPRPRTNRGPVQIQTHVENLKIGAFEGSSEQFIPVLKQLKCLRTFSYCVSASDSTDLNSIILALRSSSVETLRELTLMRESFVLSEKNPRFPIETRVALSRFHQLQSLTLPVWYFLSDRQGDLDLVFPGIAERFFLPIPNAIPASVKQLVLTETANAKQLGDLIRNLIALRENEPQQLLELILLEFPQVPRHVISRLMGHRPLAQVREIDRLHIAMWKKPLWDVRVVLRSVFDLEPFHKNTSALAYTNFKQAKDIVRRWYTQAGAIQFPQQDA